MNAVIVWANGLALHWAARMWPVLWQTAILAAIVGLVIVSVRRMPPAMRFWLWMLVPLRLLVMPLMVIALPVLANPPAAQPKPAEAPVSIAAPARAEASDTESTLGDFAQLAFPARAEAFEPNWTAAQPISPIAQPPIAVAPIQKHVRASLWTWLMAGWMAGIGFFALRLARGWLRMKEIARRAQVSGDPRVRNCAREAAAMLGLRKIPRILTAAEGVSPFVLGIIRPVVVLPAALAGHIRPEELRAVLAHEFAHVRRRDALIGWVLACADVVYFFNPVAYFARSRIMFERERDCDEQVMALAQAPRGVYARALLSAAGLKHPAAGSLSCAPVLLESGRHLERRLKSMSDEARPCAPLSRKARFALMAITALAIPGFTLTARSAPTPAGAAEDKPKAEAAESVTLRSGDRITGHIVSIGADGFLRMTAPSMERETALRVAALQRADFTPTAKEADPHVVLLNNGDSVAGTVSAVTAAQVVIESSAAGKLAIDRSFVKSVRLASKGAPNADVNHEMVLLANGDSLAADGLILNGGQLTVKTDVGEIALPLARVGAITFRSSTRKMPEANPKAICVRTVRTTLTLDSVELLDDKALTGRAACLGGPVRIERAALKWVIFGPADPIRFNSDVPLSVYYRPSKENVFEKWKWFHTNEDMMRKQSGGWMVLGSTPAAEPLIIPAGCEWAVGPAGCAWGVRPKDGPMMTPAFVEEMRNRRIPRLRLVAAIDSDLASLKEMTDLQSLDLSFTQVTDEGLANLKEMTGLQSLDLHNCNKVTDAGLANLKGMTGLRALDLSWTQVTDAGLANLKEMTGLQSLKLTNATRVTDAGLANLKGMTGMQTLYLDGLRVTDDGLANLKEMKGMQCLYLPQAIIPRGGQWYVVTDAGLANLKEMTGMQTLDMGGCTEVTDAGLANLKGMTGLQQLNLSQVSSVTDAGLANLKEMTGLQALNLNETRVTDAGLANLKEMTGLQGIVLSGTQVTDVGLANLQEMSDMQFLDLRGTQATDAGMACLKEMKSLRMLIPPDKLTNAGLATLEEMKSLKELNLLFTGITEAGMATLKEMTNLQVLVLSKGIGFMDVPTLKASLPKTEIVKMP